MVGTSWLEDFIFYSYPIYFYRIPRGLPRGFRAITKSVPVWAKFRNTPSACGGDRNFEDFDSLLIDGVKDEIRFESCQVYAISLRQLGGD